MANFKVVLNFSQGGSTWGEQYYRTASDLNTASGFDNEFRLRALRMKHPSTRLTKIRVSEVTNNRNSVVVPNTVRVAASSSAPDVVATAAVCKLVSLATGASREVWIRGLIDSQVFRDEATGNDIPQGALPANLTAWIASLSANGFSVRSLQKINGTSITYKKLNQIVIAADGTVTFTAETGWTLSSSGRVILSQLDKKLFPALNGHWKIYNVSGTTFTVSYRSHLAAGTYPLYSGRTRPEEFDYGGINASRSGFAYFGTRQTKNVSTGSRGKRSTQVLRSA